MQNSITRTKNDSSSLLFKLITDVTKWKIAHSMEWCVYWTIYCNWWIQALLKWVSFIQNWMKIGKWFVKLWKLKRPRFVALALSHFVVINMTSKQFLIAKIICFKEKTLAYQSFEVSFFYLAKTYLLFDLISFDKLFFLSIIFSFQFLIPYPIAEKKNRKQLKNRGKCRVKQLNSEIIFNPKFQV